MKWTKVREKIAALVAIILVIVLLSVGSVIMGYNIPVLADISHALGVRGGQ